MLDVSHQGFYKYLANKDRPWKYQDLADAMKEICSEDECNDTYGRIRMYQALLLKQPEGVPIPSERTVYWVMEQIGLSHRPNRKPNGITKVDRESMKSDGKLYVSAIFDCFDLGILDLAMETNMKAELLYDRYKTEQMTIEALKILIWRYFLSYWNNRRICTV